MNKKDVIESEKYIIASIDKNTGRFSTSSSPKTHTLLASAKAEAGRLAQENTEKEFVVLKVEAIATVQKIAWR